MKKPLYTILSHIATWIVLFLLPMSFRPMQFSASLVPTLAVIAVFYINYSLITPYYYMRGYKSLCWLGNLVLVVSIALVLHHWLGVGRGYVFNLAVAVMIAISMRLGMIWQEAEEARLAAEAAKADAELSNLRYQTNPHFLLNTLNNIYALTAFDTRRAQEAIQQLSGMLRHILYDNQEKEVQMKDEVNFLQNYVNLMKIRQPGSVDITFDTQHVYPQAKIVPLLLIPLIENAFKHGVSPTQPSFIHIRLEADKSSIDFLIENTNHPKLANDQSGHGIGLAQVQRRLDLAYAGHYRWTHGLKDDGAVYFSHITIEQ